MEQILNTNPFQTSKILGGAKGLHRNVSTVTVAEVPDAANWLRGGELVCTTAYFISKGIKYQMEWVESLVVNGAAALAIKTSRFLGEVPSSIIKIANQLNFPIIEIPTEVTWPNVIESVMNLLMDTQINILQRTEEVHNALISLVLENESVQVIANKISSLVGNPIIIEDARLNHISMSQNIIDKEKNNKFIEERLSPIFKEKIAYTDFYKNVLSSKTKETLELPLKSNIHVNTITVPILSNKMVYGFISVIAMNKKVSQFDLIILEHATTTLALQFMKQIIHERTLRTRTVSMINDLVNGRFGSDLVKEFYLNHNDWIKPVVMAVVELGGDTIIEESYDWDTSTEQLTEKIKYHLLNHFDNVFVGRSETSTLYVLAFFQVSMVSSAASTLGKELDFILSECKHQELIHSYFAGVGSTQNDLQQVGKSFNEALSAKSIAKSFQMKGPIVLYQDLGIHRIISMVHHREELSNFCNDFLADLVTHDNQNNDVLRETLYVYLQNGGNAHETAKRMFVHPNTIAYRLKKIQSVIKRDINSWEVRFTYLFALEAAEILDNPYALIGTE
ncbi:PucR family transcriptional regulator [Bacillus timonensis]|uniref:PucR family transcriptional regulator n=1 Tax=Bacillus timonensis TaxID=1033734 RepID=UPI001F5E630B|nr:PucR family transcriptional regulator [Bacillus timonensis]